MKLLLTVLLIVWMQNAWTQVESMENPHKTIEQMNEKLTQQLQPQWLLKRSQAYRQLGFFRKAINDLQLLEKQAYFSSDKKLQATTYLNLAQLHQLKGYPQLAKKYFLQAKQLAEQINQALLLAHIYDFSANFIQTEAKKKEQDFKLATQYARKTDETHLEIQILINQIRLDNSSSQLSYLRFQRVQTLLDSKVDDNEFIRLRIALAVQAIEHNYRKMAYEQLQKSLKFAEKQGNARLLSVSQGHLGHLYELNQRFQDAFQWTQRAIFDAQSIAASDLLLQWEWQAGRLHRKQQQIELAIAAYRRAVNHIETIRQDIPVQYQDGKSSFRETLAPIYQQLVQLLLKHSQQQAKSRQDLLSESLQIVETLKTAEMQDYFKDSCAVQQSKQQGWSLPKGSAVIYPMIFENQMGILMQIGDDKSYFPIKASLRNIRRLAMRTNASLRPLAGGYFRAYSRASAYKLYRLLIEPLISKLEQAKVHTLVNAPDGFLRQIPLGALWTGKHYLIEDYAVVNVPGLSLMEISPRNKTAISALVAGVSKPGEVVEELPDSVQSILAMNEPQAHQDNLTRGIRLRALPEENQVSELEKPLSNEVKDRIQTALQLPGVVDEVNNIEAMIPATKLLNVQFSVKNFENQMHRSYPIVHIASHGLFSGDPENSFLIAYDKVINMNMLEDFLKSEAFSDNPVEILTLSACQTAEGDDRSPLGLSGVAIKSGARSALGSLWPVADVVAKQLLPDFYQNLQKTELTKAQALQQAKLKLLKQKKYQHPGLWSSFVLIGNWL